MKKYLLTLLMFVGFTMVAMAQAAADKPPMADAFRSEGKIYVVVAVLGLVFAGLCTYLIMIDRKVAKLEKQAGIK